MIKFHTHPADNTQLTFGMVEVGQFFINKYGNLCQKSISGVYFIIAHRNGAPFGSQIETDDNQSIQKILPRVTKITWE
jgi:hypothetical protein